jgi:hypothetical protein
VSRSERAKFPHAFRVQGPIAAQKARQALAAMSAANLVPAFPDAIKCGACGATLRTSLDDYLHRSGRECIVAKSGQRPRSVLRDEHAHGSMWGSK